MLSLAVHFDATELDAWSHLAEAYRVDHVYCVGLPENLETSKWSRVAHVNDAPCPEGGSRVFFSPEHSPGQPGTIGLPAFSHPKNGIYIFGDNDGHNSGVECDRAVYIPTPGRNVTLYAAQAGLIALYERFTYGYHR